MTVSEYFGIFGTLFVVMSAGISAWVSLRIKVAEQAVRIEELEKKHEGFRETVDSIFKELKEIRDMLHEKVDRR